MTFLHALLSRLRGGGDALFARGVLAHLYGRKEGGAR